MGSAPPELDLMNALVDSLQHADTLTTSNWVDDFFDTARSSLLEKRGRDSESEMVALDAWGECFDRAEVLNAILLAAVSLTDIRLKEVEESGLHDLYPWWLCSTAAYRCIDLSDDLIMLLRRGSVATAFAASRTIHESALTGQALAAHPSLAEKAGEFQTRAAARASKDFFKALIKQGAGKAASDAERQVREMTKERELHHGDLGWLHETLVANDQEYAYRAKRGLTDTGPTVSDLERLVDARPIDRALRSLANQMVHGNIVFGDAIGAYDQAYTEWLLRGSLRETRLAATAALSLADEEVLDDHPALDLDARAFDLAVLHLDKGLGAAIDAASDKRTSEH